MMDGNSTTPPAQGATPRGGATGVPDSADAAMPSTLARDVRRAVIWRSGSQIVGQVIAWAVTLIVLNLLRPADYGLYAMAAVMMTILDFLNGYGVASALIQQKDVSPRIIRQALGIMICLNTGIAIIQFAAAPLVAAYFGKPEVEALLHHLAFIYLATPFIIVPEVLLSRSLDFKRQAIANLTGAVVGAAVSLGCALAGYGVWTLVYAPIALFYTRAICLTVAARMYILPIFDFTGTGHIVRFGGALMISHLCWVVQSQADVTIAGRVLTEHDVGLYATALFMSQLIVAKFVPPLNQVAFPAYAKLQDNPAAVRNAFLDSIRLIMLVTAPIFLGIAAVAPTLIATLFKPEWQAMVPLIQLTALAMPALTLQVLFPSVNNAMGRPQLSMRASLFGAAIFLVGFLVGVRYGTMGLAAAWLVCAPALLLVTAAISKPATGADLSAIFAAAAPALLSATGMAAMVLGFDAGLAPHIAPLPHLIIQVIGGALAYFALSRWLQWSTVLRLAALVRGRSGDGATAAVA
jgi:O-antigen/teichoic acid export membrane protein